MSNDATSIYSTWFSVSPRGYWDRNFRVGCASGLYLRGAERDECGEDTPLDRVFEAPELGSEVGSEVRSISILVIGFGDLEGRLCDISDVEREEGKDDREVLRFTALPLEIVEAVVPVVSLVVGRCTAAWRC